MDTCVHEGCLVFAEKTGSDGDVMRKKVRIVAKWYMEVWGEDYTQTYSPTLGQDTLFSCLTYAATNDFEIHQMDPVAAYLNSDLNEEICLRPPDGIPMVLGTIWHLKKALYRLKQAGLEWYHTLWTHFKLISYAQSTYDPCLYIQDPSHFVLVYVDNFIVVDVKEMIVRSNREFSGKYQMMDLSECHWFLTMEISHDWV